MLNHHAPTTVGPYELIRKLDGDGPAIVHVARQRLLDRVVALKEFRRPPRGTPDFAERFVAEARIAGALSHRHLVGTFDCLVVAGRAYIATEYLPNGSLRAPRSRLSPAQLAGVLEGVLAALRHAHAHAVVHGDIRPDNVLVDEHGVVKLADIGVAPALRAAAPLGPVTAGGFTAPEHVLTGEASFSGDLYSVGRLAAELGRHGPPPDPRLAAWIARMTAPAPEDRPAGAGEAWRELEAIVAALEEPLWRRRAALDVPTQPDRGGWPERPALAPGRSTSAARTDPAPTPSTSAEHTHPAPTPPTSAEHTHPAPAPSAPAAREPARRPRRSRRRAVLIGAGCALLVAAGGAYAVLGPLREEALDVRRVEATVRTAVADQTPVGDVRCPRDVPGGRSVRFACDVSLANTDRPWVAIVTHRPGERDAVELRLR